jgi:hypothetical protein
MKTAQTAQESSKPAQASAIASTTEGISCPDCRNKMRVFTTRTLSEGVFRVRICDRCHLKIPTEERPI